MKWRMKPQRWTESQSEPFQREGGSSKAVMEGNETGETRRRKYGSFICFRRGMR